MPESKPCRPVQPERSVPTCRTRSKSCADGVEDAHGRPAARALFPKPVVHRVLLIRVVRFLIREHQYQRTAVAALDHGTVGRRGNAEVAGYDTLDLAQ